MTDSQRVQFYFKQCWTPTVAVLDWAMRGGRLSANLEEQLALSQRWPDHAAPLFNQIVEKAQAIAKGGHRAVDVEALRHACNWIATQQRTTSSKDFKQREANHFDRLCAVLRDPWDLNARLAWLHPEQDDQKRLVAYLRTTAWEAAIIAIAGNKYPDRHWTDLTYDELNNVYREVRERPQYHRRQSPARQRAGHPF